MSKHDLGNSPLDGIVTFIDDVRHLGRGRGNQTTKKKVTRKIQKVTKAPERAVTKAKAKVKAAVGADKCKHRGIKRGQVCGGCGTKLL